jgi:hypothetical protein
MQCQVSPAFILSVMFASHQVMYRRLPQAWHLLLKVGVEQVVRLRPATQKIKYFGNEKVQKVQS